MKVIRRKIMIRIWLLVQNFKKSFFPLIKVIQVRKEFLTRNIYWTFLFFFFLEKLWLFPQRKIEVARSDLLSGRTSFFFSSKRSNKFLETLYLKSFSHVSSNDSNGFFFPPDRHLRKASWQPANFVPGRPINK